MTDRDRDILILAMTAYAEARGEGSAGIRAQAHSVLNRHAAGRWYSRKTVAGTCLAPYAYSAMNTSDPNRVAAVEVPMADPVMAVCIQEATDAIDGLSLDPTMGATHYYREGTPEPRWVTGLDESGNRVAPPAIFCIQINHHLFFKDVT